MKAKSNHKKKKGKCGVGLGTNQGLLPCECSRLELQASLLVDFDLLLPRARGAMG